MSQYVFTGEISFAEARASGMVRCPECSQHKCTTPAVIRTILDEPKTSARMARGGQ